MNENPSASNLQLPFLEFNKSAAGNVRIVAPMVTVSARLHWRCRLCFVTGSPEASVGVSGARSARSASRRKRMLWG